LTSRQLAFHRRDIGKMSSNAPPGSHIDATATVRRAVRLEPKSTPSGLSMAAVAPFRTRRAGGTNGRRVLTPIVEA